MDLTVSTPRFSAYFALGLAWRPQSLAVDTGSSSGSGQASSGRIIDVQAQSQSQARQRTLAPTPQTRRQSNIFLSQSSSVRYERTAQSVRLVPASQIPGQILDTWA